MMKSTLACLLSVILLSGCLLHSGPFALWMYTDGIPIYKDSLVNPASFLELKPDHSYTRDFGEFEYGTWSLDAGGLHLINQEHITQLYSPVVFEGITMSLDKENFERSTLPSADEDPFSLDNNRWRIPAAHRETDAEIKQRLYNHCAFWKAYFSWALDKGIHSVDVRSTPTPLKIYGNGFTLKAFTDLPLTWINYFYDEDDCKKASAMLEDIVTHKNIAISSSDNKYKVFIGIFEQMERYLK
jgi:hypothetical protein